MNVKAPSLPDYSTARAGMLTRIRKQPQAPLQSLLHLQNVSLNKPLPQLAQ